VEVVSQPYQFETGLFELSYPINEIAEQQELYGLQEKHFNRSLVDRQFSTKGTTQLRADKLNDSIQKLQT